MITQIEIDGFKTFKDFKVELAPFQVIVGPNGSGKSNLFDALHLLSRLAETDLRSAFQEVRGDTNELFTTLPDGQHVDRIRMAVEMLVDQSVKDNLGKKTTLKYTRLHYEIEIIQHVDEYGLEQLHVTYESLKPISRDKDNWCKKYNNLFFQNRWLSEAIDDEVTFIDTDYDATSSERSLNSISLASLISLYPDRQSQELIRQFNSWDLQLTVLSSVTNIEHPHVFAAREELRSFIFLHLNPEVLRQPSSVNAQRFLSPEGKNMPTMLVRMQAEDSFALRGVSIDMSNLVPGIHKIRVEKNQARNEYDIWAKTSDQRSFSAQVLSDGTLRLLALATLRNDPQFHGVLCLEEPENGVDPLHLKNMTRLLREMATDFNDPEQVDEPLRQVLITTHSPTFISQPDVIDSLLLTIAPTRVQGKGAPSLQVTRMVPIVTSYTLLKPGAGTNEDTAVEAYSIDMIRKYLDSNRLEEASSQLEEARAILNER